jgi:predicted RNase H-like nuclease (RuvC/YqgF family)
MELPKDLKDKVWNYCRLNDITDVNGFIIKTIKKGLDVEVYGLLGKTLNEDEKYLKTGIVGEKQVEIEVIREIRVEVPVEVIKEVEKIVTKIEYISDKNGETELLLKIQQLEEEFSTKTTEMENIFQNKMSKKDNELNELRQKLDDPVTNNNINMLQETLQKLRKEMSNKDEKIKELEKINNNLQNTTQNNVGAIFLRGSNLNNIL